MNILVRIRFYAMFKEVVGKKEIVFDFQSETTLGEVLKMLEKEYDKDFKEIIDKKTGQIDINTLVMLNGYNVRDPNLKLKNKDMVIITVPVGGG